MEAAALLAVLQNFAKKLENKKIIFQTDNAVVYWAVKNSRSRSEVVQEIALSILCESKELNAVPEIFYIGTHSNLADWLTRRDTDDRSLNPEYERLWKSSGIPIPPILFDEEIKIKWPVPPRLVQWLAGRHDLIRTNSLYRGDSREGVVIVKKDPTGMHQLAAPLPGKGGCLQMNFDICLSGLVLPPSSEKVGELPLNTTSQIHSSRTTSHETPRKRTSPRDPASGMPPTKKALLSK